MGTYREEKADIEAFFTDGWGSTTATTFENGEPDPAPDEWVRLSIQGADAFQADMGDNPSFRNIGIIYLQVFTRKDIGSGRAIELADIAEALFKIAVIPGPAGVRCKVPLVTRVPSGQASEWCQVNVSTEFYRGS